MPETVIALNNKYIKNKKIRQKPTMLTMLAQCPVDQNLNLTIFSFLTVHGIS